MRLSAAAAAAEAQLSGPWLLAGDASCFTRAEMLPANTHTHTQNPLLFCCLFAARGVFKPPVCEAAMKKEEEEEEFPQ